MAKKKIAIAKATWNSRDAAIHLRVGVGTIRKACVGRTYSGIVLRHVRVGRAIRTCLSWVDAWAMAHVV